MTDLKAELDVEKQELSWTLENGYTDHTRFLNNYPMNDVGGMFGKPYSFIFSSLNDNSTLHCEAFQGFKVSWTIFLRKTDSIISFEHFHCSFVFVFKKAFLHPPNDIPIYTSHYIKIPIGTDVRISVVPKMTSTSEEVDSYPAEL